METSDKVGLILLEEVKLGMSNLQLRCNHLVVFIFLTGQPNGSFYGNSDRSAAVSIFNLHQGPSIGISPEVDFAIIIGNPDCSQTINGDIYKGTGRGVSKRNPARWNIFKVKNRKFSIAVDSNHGHQDVCSEKQ
mmetsp:Transcript_26890/g.25949  ORF Transcript_26890/g.25949 Transcript_26890/m.25949 type:complete len:134 (+) Transcript_26890:208-609(+)